MSNSNQQDRDRKNQDHQSDWQDRPGQRNQQQQQQGQNQAKPGEKNQQQQAQNPNKSGQQSGMGGSKQNQR